MNSNKENKCSSLEWSMIRNANSTSTNLGKHRRTLLATKRSILRKLSLRIRQELSMSLE